MDLYEVSTPAIEFAVNEIVYDAAGDVMLRVTAVNGAGPYTYDTVAAVEADLENILYANSFCLLTFISF